MTPLDYDYLRKLLRERSGLVLSADKQYLVESRLLPVARRSGLGGLGELVQKLRDPNAERLAVDVVEAMTTNESFFFRDKIPFQHFEDTMMPALLATRAPHRRIRIWCSAASTGQEPYSLAMALKELGDRTCGWRIEIVATDLSTKVLNSARAGLWPIDKSADIPEHYRKAYMLRGTGSQLGKMKAGAEIRSVITFSRLNLNDPPYPVDGVFDFIFCRNVLIYFDLESKKRVVERLLDHLAQNGCLFLGYAETTSTISDRLHSVGPNVYARCPRPGP
jgi:chemotaxis protein methyltransferase CheR